MKKIVANFLLLSCLLILSGTTTYVYAQNLPVGQNCGTCNPTCTGTQQCKTTGNGISCSCQTVNTNLPVGQTCTSCNPTCTGTQQCRTTGFGSNCSCQTVNNNLPVGQTCGTCNPTCTGTQQCKTTGNGTSCSCQTSTSTGTGSTTGGGTTGGTSPFGTVLNPFGGSAIGPQGSFIQLIANILRLVFVGAGIFAFIRVILGGLKFINAGGDAKAIGEAWQSIWQAILGLVIVVSSVAVAALLGQLLFNDATAILMPKIYAPQ